MLRIYWATAALCGFAMLPSMALAHAHLVASTPAANARVAGPNVTMDLRFNSRVDGQHSMLKLVKPDGTTETLKLDGQHDATMLDAHAKLERGRYTLLWQALAPDGHITRGEIPFMVQ